MAAESPSVKRYVVRLSAEERQQLEAMICKGKSPAQRLLKARILLSVGIALQLLLNLKRKPLHAAPHVRMTRRDPNPASQGYRDHDRRAFKVAEISADVAPAQIRTRASFTSTTITPGSGKGAAVVRGAAATASSIRTGAKPETAADFSASRRQRYTRLVQTSARRATSATTAPGSAISAKIRVRSSSLQRRRRSFPVINVIRLMLCS